MSESPNVDVVFCGIVRDCARNLTRNLENLENNLRAFGVTRFIFIENDSIDGTKSVLHKFHLDKPESVIETFDANTVTLPKSLPGLVLPSYSKHRISKMVDYRNKYLKALEELDGVGDATRIVMIDWDVREIDFSGLLEVVSDPNFSGVKTANGRQKTDFFKDCYYDAYAFCPIDKQGAWTVADILSCRDTMNSFNATSSVMPVQSAFGGLAVYRMCDIRDLRYRVVENTDVYAEVWCEHVTFHRDLALPKDQNVVVDARLKVSYDSRIEAVMRSIKKRIKQILIRK